MDMKGLSDQEVRERASAGLINSYESPVSRSYGDIIIKNALTMFNLILFVLGGLLIYFQEYISALSATGIIVLNIFIATIQEMKAKRRLDKIALLLRPTVAVVRNGEEVEIDPSGIVMDDVVHMTSGSQAQVDGEIIASASMEMDESLLSGEASTRRKHVGDTIYSGSFCVTGDGYYRVTALGDRTYASEMLVSAKKYKKKKTPLQMETTTVTEMLMVIAFIYLAIMVVVNLLSQKEAVTSVIESVLILDIVPVALFLLITITYMIAAVRMADSGVLLQNSSSVESMSHVDTVCMDKTGTITTNNLIYSDIRTFSDRDSAIEDVRLLVSATGSRNRTVKAIAEGLGELPSELLEEVPFSSDRKYSAVRVRYEGRVHTVFMGAWSALRDSVSTDLDIGAEISEISRRGLRTVLICSGGDAAIYDGEEPSIPALHPVAIISIEDEVRADCKEIINGFLSNGMDLKVISGDDPETIDAIFSIADIPGERRIVSGEELEKLSGEELDAKILESNIFGRMKPDQKETVIESLKRNGRYVAMVGDGVNDVKSIKSAQVGVALQSGSGATRGVADMILLDDRFSALPRAIIEGKRTVSGMRDILKLYLTRNFVLAILVLVLLMFFHRLPMLPVQNAYYALISVSFAAFLMAIWARPSENKELVLPDVIRFSMPMSIMIAVFALAVYMLFSLGTDGGLFNIPYDGMYDLVKDTMTPEEFYQHMGGTVNGWSEVFARNAMLIFLVLAGISQLFLIYPLRRFYSINGNVSKDLKPTLLALLLFGLVVLLYNIPEVSVLVASLVLFPAEYYLLIIGVVAVWFFSTLRIMRSSKLNKITELTESAYEKKLKTEFEKNDD